MAELKLPADLTDFSVGTLFHDLRGRGRIEAKYPRLSVPPFSSSSTTCEVVAELKLLVRRDEQPVGIARSTTCEVVAELKPRSASAGRSARRGSTTCEVVAELKPYLPNLATLPGPWFHDLRGRGRIEACR